MPCLDLAIILSTKLCNVLNLCRTVLLQYTQAIHRDVFCNSMLHTYSS